MGQYTKCTMDNIFNKSSLLCNNFRDTKFDKQIKRIYIPMDNTRHIILCQLQLTCQPNNSLHIYAKLYPYKILLEDRNQHKMFGPNKIQDYIPNIVIVIHRSIDYILRSNHSRFHPIRIN